MPRSNLTITGLDFGKAEKNLAYYYGLSDFWSAIFQDSDKIELLLEASSQKLSDVYSQFLQLAATISIADIGTATNQQLKLVLINEDSAVEGQLNTFTLPEPILEARLIVNRPFLPTAYYEDEVHYRLIDDGTTIQFFTGISVMGFPSRTLTSGTKQYALWFVDTLIDEQALYDYFGKLIGVNPQASTDAYKNFIYGLYYLYTNGPNLALLRKGLNLALGIPLARETETVLEIRKYLETDQWLVITDSNSYLIPFGLEPTVAVGDVLTATEELAQWIEVKDFIQDGAWWINLAIPPAIMPYVPTGEVDRFAKAGSYADSLMRNFLKKHTFLVNVKTIDFKNSQTFAQLSSIINEVKPSYTYPIYIWTVPVTDENIPLDDNGLALRWDQFRCENISVPISRMKRLNAFYSVVAAKPISIVQSDNIRLTNQQSMYRNARTDVALTGEMYWEVTIEAITNSTSIGVGTTATSLYTQLGIGATAWVYANNGQKRTNNVNSAYGASYTVGDVIGIQYNVGTGTLTFYKNGVSQGTAFTGIVGTVYPMFGSRGGDGAFLYTSSLVTGNYASTPDSAALSVPSSIDLRTLVSVDDIPIPTFSLDLKDLGSGQVNITPLIGTFSPTFIRTTSATTYNSSGTLISVAPGVPRSYYDPTTLEYRGYISEGTRTNLALQSEDFSTTWSNNNITLGANALAAPDGNVTADLFTETTDGGALLHHRTQTITKAASALAYTFSVYAKAATRGVIGLQCLNGAQTAGVQTTYNLLTGLISAPGTSVFAGGFSSATSTITALPNGWYRITISFVSDTDTSLLFRVIAGNGTAYNYTGTGASCFYVWGAQLEQAGFATSYIPTTTVVVVRNGDVLFYPGVLSNIEGTALAWFTLIGSTPLDPGRILSSETNGGSVLTDNGSGTGVQIWDGVLGNSNAVTLLDGKVHKGSSAWRALTSEKIASADGGIGTAVTYSGTIVGVQLHIGGTNTAAVSPLNGTILKVACYPTRLPNTQIQKLSSFESRGLIGKWRTTGNQRSYVLSFDIPNCLTLSTSADGTNVVRFISDAFTLTSGTKTFFRVTLDTSALNSVAIFYTSVDAGVTWVPIGNTKIRAGIVSLFDSTAAVEIGSTNDGSASTFIGKTYYVGYANGLNVGETYLLLSGVALNYASTPDSITNSITGDIDFRIKTSLNSWTPAAINGLSRHWNAIGNQRSWEFRVNTDGKLQASFTTDGITQLFAVSTSATGFSNGSTNWVRFTRASSIGTVQFLTSPDGIAWSQLGTNVSTTAGSLFDSTDTFNLGLSGSGGDFYMSGKIYYADLRGAINGTIVSVFDPSTAPLESTSFTSSTGEIWTINRNGNFPARLVTERVVARFEPAQLQYTGATTLNSDTGEVWTINQNPTKYISLPGVIGNYASTPDSVANSVTGDIDIRVRLTASDWTPATFQVALAKWGGSVGSSAYEFGLDTGSTGKLIYDWSTGAVIPTYIPSTVATGIRDGLVKWIRVTHDVDNGAAGNDVRFYLSDDGNTWTQLGTTITTAGVTSINNSAGDVIVGQQTGQFPVAGKIFYAEIRNGIDGPVVAKFDPSFNSLVGASSFTSSTGEVWTINTSGVTPAAIVADLGQADIKIIPGNESTIKANMGAFPFAFTVPTTSAEGVYTEDVNLTRGCPQFTRDTCSNFTYGQMGHDSQINARALTYEGGIISGYLNSVRPLRSNTREEDAWIRTVLTRNHGSHRVDRGKMMFIRGEPIATIEGMGVRVMSQTDSQRTILLHIVTQADLVTKYATLGLTPPPLSTWTWSLFQPDRTGTPVDARSVDDEFTNSSAATITVSSFNTFFNKGPTSYLGNFMPQLSYQSYAPLFTDVFGGDYLLFWRVYENTVGVFWVTSNSALEVPFFKVAETTDPIAIYSGDSPLKYGLAPYSTYYLLRGLGGNIATTLGNTIDSVPVDAKEFAGSSALTKLYADDANPVAVSITRNNTKLNFRRDFK